MNINDIIAILKSAQRIGADKDEPEGTRYIMLSDTLASKIITCLESYEYDSLP